MAGLIAHEWIERHGGAEKVLDVVADRFRDAPIHCLWTDAPERYADRRVIESRLATTPLRRAKAISLPLMSRIWRQTDTTDADWVFASSHAFAHHVGSDGGLRDRPTYVYTHTPARYLWVPELDHRGASLLGRLGRAPLRALDRKHAGGANYAANSHFVARRIMNAWGIEATVIHPPVDVERLQSIDDWSSQLGSADQSVMETLPRDYIIGASRFVPYKALDKVIAFGEALGIPVVLAGGGPLAGQLRALASDASVPVTIIERPSDELLYTLIQRSMAFVFPSIEDFGIMPVEAAALGTPVVVNRLGGAAESLSVTAGGSVHDFDDDTSARSSFDKAVGSDKSFRTLSTYFSAAAFSMRIANWMGL